MQTWSMLMTKQNVVEALNFLLLIIFPLKLQKWTLNPETVSLPVIPSVPFASSSCLIHAIVLHVKYFVHYVWSTVISILLSFQASVLCFMSCTAKWEFTACAIYPTKSDWMYITLCFKYINSCLSTYSLLSTTLFLFHLTHTIYLEVLNSVTK